MANPWFPFYVDDYERKTAHLTMLQHGAYGELIRRYYMVGGPLPANAVQLHRMCRATDEQERAAIDCCLEQFFRLEDDGWHNDRCDEELAKSREISEKRAKSASSRHSKSTSNCNANAPAIAEQVQTQLQPQLHINTPPNPLKEGEPKKRKRRSREQILQPYPAEVSETVNALISTWPEVQPADRTPITVDVPKLAERIDAILKEPNVTPEIIKLSAERYLAEPKRYYKHPQFFFGIGNGETAHWSTYARMVVHQQAKAVNQ